MTRQLGNVVLSFAQGMKLRHSFSSITFLTAEGLTEDF